MSDINVNLELLDKLLNDLNRENGQLSRFSTLLDNANYAQNTLQPMRRLQRRRFMKGLLRRSKNDALTDDDRRIISGIGDSAEEFSNQSRRDVIKLGRDLVNGGLTNRLGSLTDEVNNSNNSITNFKKLIDKLKLELATSIVEPKIEKEVKTDPVPKVDNTDLSSFKSFGEAFREARKNKLTEFKWKPTKANPSGRFSTELASSTLKTPQVTPNTANTSNTTPSKSVTTVADKNEANTSSSSSVTAATGNNGVNYVERLEPEQSYFEKTRNWYEEVFGIKLGNLQNSLSNNSTTNSSSNTSSTRNSNAASSAQKQAKQTSTSNTGGNWFNNIMLGGLMGELPAYAIASGWRLDENGNFVLDQLNDPGVKALRASLGAIGVAGAAELLGPIILGLTTSKTVGGVPATRTTGGATTTGGMPATTSSSVPATTTGGVSTTTTGGVPATVPHRGPRRLPGPSNLPVPTSTPKKPPLFGADEGTYVPYKDIVTGIWHYRKGGRFKINL